MKWIKCSERMPEDHKPVLTIVKYSNEIYNFLPANRSKSQWFFLTPTEPNPNPIMWTAISEIPTSPDWWETPEKESDEMD